MNTSAYWQPVKIIKRWCSIGMLADVHSKSRCNFKIYDLGRPYNRLLQYTVRLVINARVSVSKESQDKYL